VVNLAAHAVNGMFEFARVRHVSRRAIEDRRAALR
jgi:hypothetical protein